MDNKTLENLRMYRDKLKYSGEEQKTISEDEKLPKILRASATGQSIAYKTSISLLDFVFKEIRE